MGKIQTLEEVTEAKIHTLFYSGRVDRHWSVNTYLVYYKSLKVFFRWCIKQGYMTTNYVDTVEVPKLEKRIPEKLNKQAALKLLEVVYNYPYQYKYLRYRNHAMFAMFIFAGLRKTELLKLKYADVDIENFTIFVQQGKGKKDRIIPMSYTLAQILKKYMEERKRWKKTCPEFFTSVRHNRGLSKDSMKTIIDAVTKKTGIKFTPHKLRHTFATLMLEGGCDIYSLSQMMGHSDIKTTTIYLSATAEHLRSQMMKHPLNN